MIGSLIPTRDVIYVRMIHLFVQLSVNIKLNHLFFQKKNYLTFWSCSSINFKENSTRLLSQPQKQNVSKPVETVDMWFSLEKSGCLSGRWNCPKIYVKQFYYVLFFFLSKNVFTHSLSTVHNIHSYSKVDAESPSSWLNIHCIVHCWHFSYSFTLYGLLNSYNVEKKADFQ